jgi:hypothetical protein
MALPTNTNPVYPQYMAQNQNVAPQPAYCPQMTGLIADWVNGYAGAQAYRLLPNTKAILLDAEEAGEGKMYFKTTDNMGMPQIRTFEFKEVEHVEPAAPAQAQPMDGFVTKEEFGKTIDDLKAYISDQLRPRRSDYNDRKQNNKKRYEREERHYEDEQ